MKRELLTISEYAESQEVTRDTIYKQIKEGRVKRPAIYKKVAGKHFISVPANLIKERV